MRVSRPRVCRPHTNYSDSSHLKIISGCTARISLHHHHIIKSHLFFTCRLFSMSQSPSQRSLRSPNPLRGAVVDENVSGADENPVAPSPIPPVPWLRPLSAYGVMLCTEHQSCYTPGTNLREHLKRKHSVSVERAKEIITWLATQNLSATVIQPPDHTLFIPGLQFREGWVCATGSCRVRFASKDKIQRHCSKEHQVDPRRKQTERQMYTEVMLQWFFRTAQAEQYWIVQRELSGSSRHNSPGASMPSSSVSRHESPRTPVPSSSVMSIRSSATTPSRPSHANIINTLTASAESAIKEDEGRYRQLGEPNHVSEITPWLRISKFHVHLAGLDSDAIATSHLTPRTDDDDARLYEVVWSVERVLHKAYQLVPDLLHVDARVLNTFQSGTTSQDPFNGCRTSHHL